jgi:hypothetical protein
MRAMSAWVRGAAVVVVLGACGGCSDGGGASLSSFGVDDGASRGAAKSVDVSANKGGHIALKTGAELDVPAGAVDKSVKLTMERPADGKAIELVERFKKDQDRIVSAPYVLTPHGTKFKEDVSVTLPVSKGGSGEIAVAWLEDENDTEWKLLGVAKSDGKKAEVKIKHFSVLVVIEDASDLEPVPEIIDDGVDGGTSEPSADGGIGPGPDASVGDAGDGIPMVPDAGAGVRDAGMMMPPLDSGTGPVGPPLNDAGLAIMNQLDKLEGCGFVTVPGKFAESGYGAHPRETGFNLCVHDCFNSNLGSCMDAQIYRCNKDDQVSFEVASCLSTCQAPIVEYCPEDPLTPVLHCDGKSECVDGRDEMGCDGRLYFDCGDGKRIAQTERCDGTADCSNSVDETGCFACDGGSSLFSSFFVCDGTQDCGDGADEQGCAEISCGIIQ